MRIIRTLVLISCWLLTGGVLQAQKVYYSKYDKFDYRSGEFAVVGKAGDKLYVYRGSADAYYLDAYTPDMTRTATVVLDFLPRRAYGLKFVPYKDRIVILYQATESSRVIQYAALLDADGRMQKEPVEIDNIKPTLLGGRSGLYNYAISDDKKHIVVYGVNTKGNTLTARMIWLNEELQIEKRSEAAFESDNEIAFGEGLTNTQGRFFLPVYTPYGARQYADRVWMLAMNGGEEKFDVAELPLNGLFAAGTYMELSATAGKIYVGGFYSDRKNGNYEGIIYSYYDVEQKIFRDLKNIPFTERVRIATGEKNNKKAMNDYQVKQLIVKNDGGFLLVAESFFITSRNGYSPGFGYYSWYYPSMGTMVREYNYEDIMVVSCDGAGTPEWTEFIRKNQYSQEDGGLFSSYALINTGGTLGFMFNDFNSNRSRIQVASVDAAGKIDINALPGAANEDPDWLPRSGRQVSAREFVVPCLKRNQICFAKIVF